MPRSPDPHTPSRAVVPAPSPDCASSMFPPVPTERCRRLGAAFDLLLAIAARVEGEPPRLDVRITDPPTPEAENESR